MLSEYFNNETWSKDVREQVHVASVRLQLTRLEILALHCCSQSSKLETEQVSARACATLAEFAGRADLLRRFDVVDSVDFAPEGRIYIFAHARCIPHWNSTSCCVSAELRAVEMWRSFTWAGSCCHNVHCRQ
eukprot:1896849-Rhodomonas_salina.1